MRRPGFAAPAISSLLCAAAALASLSIAWPASAMAAGGGWSRSFRVAPGQTSDVLPARAAISSAGELAVGFARFDEDHPADSQAYVAVRSPSGQISGPRRVPGAQEVLDLAYLTSGLQLLTGASEPGLTCCSYARVTPLAGGRFGQPHTVVARLAGAALGRLIGAGSDKLLAVVGTGQGVWDAQSPSGARLGATRRLSTRGQSPWTVATAFQSPSNTFVGWTEASPQVGDPAPRALMLAQGSALAAPHGRRVAVTVPTDHSLDEVALAPGRGTPLAAWVEGWFSSDGTYRSQALLGDVQASVHGRPFPIGGAVASGLAAAGDGTGENVVAWKACDTSAVCAVWATFRDAGRRFGEAVLLGAVDASQAPVVTVAGGGDALVAWIHDGRVFAVDRRPRSGRFSGPARVPSSFAHDLTLTSTPGGPAAAVWTEGTVAPSLLAALYRPR